MIRSRIYPPRLSRIGQAVSLAVGLCWYSSAVSQTSAPPATLTELRERLSDLMDSPRFRHAVFAVKIVSLDSGVTLFEHDAEKLQSPASNCKLYTVALALDQLGGDYRIRTSVYATSPPNKRGTINGDLIVYGRGAPDFAGRLHGGDLQRAFLPLMAVLTNAGVKRINGDLIGDSSFLRGAPFGSGWVWDDAQYYYGAEISALTVNDNILDLAIQPGNREGDPCNLSLTPETPLVTLINRTETVAAAGRPSITLYRPSGGNVTYVMGGLPIGTTNYSDEVVMHDPASFFVQFLRETMRKHGIRVTGETRTADWLERAARPVNYNRLVELGAVESLSLRDIAREIQKPSQNLYTDLLLAHLGALYQPSERPVTESAEEAGVNELRRFLEKVGIPQREVRFEEGSGLSRNNVATANATITLLEYMSRHRESAAFLNSLPVAGVDGTLRNRMKGTAAEGNVKAKTGTLRWANSLSGYVTTAAGEHLAFSMMLNRYIAPNRETSPRSELDDLAIMLAGFSSRSNAR